MRHDVADPLAREPDLPIVAQRIEKLPPGPLIMIAQKNSEVAVEILPSRSLLYAAFALASRRISILQYAKALLSA